MASPRRSIMDMPKENSHDRHVPARGGLVPFCSMPSGAFSFHVHPFEPWLDSLLAQQKRASNARDVPYSTDRGPFLRLQHIRDKIGAPYL